MAHASNELEAFINDALRHASKTQIETVLLQAGWPADQIKSALSRYADVTFSIPVPRPQVAVSAQETFIYLILFCTLYFSAYHFGSLMFDFINRALPDAAVDRAVASISGKESIRWSVSALIISFPVFLWCSRQIGRRIARDPLARLSPVRRWLTYATLFIASTILIGDLTYLIYNALGGELSTRFMLKVLTVGAIAATVFTYYLHDLGREEHP